ncbi:hypothetical protein UY3_09306 [Chelonia mydas]|uniref:Uncharacterized protein n=1 Tax=Chelonia mydas TaxID=8469 RepID=M7BDD0_CHEMY|nr:hypothetical protein UY3_09306 [Chelonia mydas]
MVGAAHKGFLTGLLKRSCSRGEPGTSTSAMHSQVARSEAEKSPAHFAVGLLGEISEQQQNQVIQLQTSEQDVAEEDYQQEIWVAVECRGNKAPETTSESQHAGKRGVCVAARGQLAEASTAAVRVVPALWREDLALQGSHCSKH